MTREGRRSQNEVWFRALNERLEARALDRGSAGATFEIVCECALEECTERIGVTASEYERVRESGTHFILVPGHGDDTLEHVVELHGDYEVVEKIGAAAVVAESQDPRA